MLNDDLNEILCIFNKFDISEEDQRRIFSKGIYFDFTYGDPDPNHRNKQLDVFGVWILLLKCKIGIMALMTKKDKKSNITKHDIN